MGGVNVILAIDGRRVFDVKQGCLDLANTYPFSWDGSTKAELEDGTETDPWMALINVYNAINAGPRIESV
jgi:hypothetical protein